PSGAQEEEENEGADVRTRAESLDKIVEEFESRPRNNDLVIEFYPPYGSARSAGRADGEAGSAGQSGDGGSPAASGEGDDASGEPGEESGEVPDGQSGAEPYQEAFGGGAPYGDTEPVRTTRSTPY